MKLLSYRLPATTHTDHTYCKNLRVTLVSETGDVQHGSVPPPWRELGGTFEVEIHKKRRAARKSGHIAPEMLTKYQNWRFVIPGRRHLGLLQFPYSQNKHYEAFENLFDVLDTTAFYTDDSSCAMDTFNLCVGKSLLTREGINVPCSHCGISYSQMEDAIVRHGYAMRMVYSGKKKTRRWPTMVQILGLDSGVFFVEFY